MMLIIKNKMVANIGIFLFVLSDHKQTENINKNPQNPNISKNSAEIIFKL